MKNKKVTLNLKEDLNSIISFRSWIKDATKDYEDRKVPDGDLDKYLGYIKRKLDDMVGKNKADWIKAIDELQESIKDGKNK